MIRIVLILLLLTSNSFAVKWEKNGKVLHPQCFTTEWLSSDNYQEFYERFTGITKNYYYSKEFEDFVMNIGKYWGKEIDTYEPIKTSWDEYIELAVSMKNCNKKKTKRFEVLKDKVVISKEKINGIWREEYWYRVLKKIPLKKCEELGPNIDGKCVESYLLKIADWGGGSMGHTFEWSIFGIFELSNGKEYIFPLKKFKSEGEGMNY